MDKRIEELRNTIEELRMELDQLFKEKNLEQYTEKSKVLDKYIEEYIDLEEKLGLLEV